MSSNNEQVSMESIDTLLNQVWKSIRGDLHAISPSAKMSKVDKIREIMNEKYLSPGWLNEQETVKGNIEVKPYISAPLMRGSSVPNQAANEVKKDIRTVTTYIEHFLPKMLKFAHEVKAEYGKSMKAQKETKNFFDDNTSMTDVDDKEMKKIGMNSHHYSIIDVEPPVQSMLGNLNFDPHQKSEKMYYSTAIPAKHLRPMTKEEIKNAAVVILEIAETIEHFDKGIADILKTLKDRGFKHSSLTHFWMQFDRSYGLLNHLWDEAKSLNVWMSRSLEG